LQVSDKEIVITVLGIGLFSAVIIAEIIKWMIVNL